MQNLEQIRARNAMGVAQVVRATKDEGNALSGYPSLVIANGLLATVAFSIHKGEQMLRIADAIAYHLSNLGEDGKKLNLLAGSTPDANGLLSSLSSPKADALLLQRCTSEALAFLAYLKRFA